MLLQPICDILPFYAWPEKARAVWQSQALPWSKNRSAQVRREYGRLLAWLDNQNVPEGQLNADLLITYGDWLRKKSSGRMAHVRLWSLIHALLVVRPEIDIVQFRQVVARWFREHSEQVRSRPARPGNHSPRESTFGLPYHSWTAEQRQAWGQATRAGGKYQGGGPLAGYRPSTLRGFYYTYSLWLGFLRRVGDVETSPSPCLVESFAEELSERMAATTAATTLHRLRKVLEALYPEMTTEYLRRHQRRLAGRRDPSPSKLPRLVHSSDLVDVGERLIERARQGRQTTANAVVFRDGLLIMLLARRPARISNIQSIRRGTELDLEAESGRLSWTPDQTKTRSRLSLALTRRLVILLKEWWDVFRPLLLTEESGQHLWLSRRGTALTVPGLRQAIERSTEAELGKRIPPHLFRDCLATMIAFERPDRIDDVSALLGHRRPGSKDGYIAVAKSLVAQHRVRDLEAAARHKSGKKKPTFRCEARR